MEGFVKGDVVVVPFPFSDLSAAKRRPALVLSSMKKGDLILCEITSRKPEDEYAVSLVPADFSASGLKHNSSVRPNKLFTADASIVLYRAGTVSKQKLSESIERACKALRN